LYYGDATRHDCKVAMRHHIIPSMIMMLASAMPSSPTNYGRNPNHKHLSLDYVGRWTLDHKHLKKL
jgi:hypothetical protein